MLILSNFNCFQPYSLVQRTMPSKKRTLVDTDLNMQPQRNAKQQKAAEAVDVENQQPATAEQSDSGNHEVDPTIAA
jgi:hypothetical protein